MTTLNPKTKYCVIHQIETGPPDVLLITSQLHKAIRCIVKDIMASDYTFKKSKLKRRIEKNWYFHSGLGSNCNYFDNYYIIPWEKKISQSNV